MNPLTFPGGRNPRAGLENEGKCEVVLFEPYGSESAVEEERFCWGIAWGEGSEQRVEDESVRVFYLVEDE